MTTYFPASKKQLRKRYNKKLLKLTLLPICLLPNAFIALYLGRSNQLTENLALYRLIIYIIISCCLGYIFVIMLIGSFYSFRRLAGNSQHTFVDIKNNVLIVSRYDADVFYKCKFIPYKKLWVINLKELEDVYFFDRKIILVAPTKLYYGKAEWFGYSQTRRGIAFDKWWYDDNGFKMVSGVDIPNMYAFPQRITKTIEKVAGTVKSKESQRQIFHEKLLHVAKEVSLERVQSKNNKNNKNNKNVNKSHR